MAAIAPPIGQAHHSDMNFRSAAALVAIAAIVVVAWQTAGGPILTIALVILGLIVLASIIASLVRMARRRS